MLYCFIVSESLGHAIMLDLCRAVVSILHQVKQHNNTSHTQTNACLAHVTALVMADDAHSLITICQAKADVVLGSRRKAAVLSQLVVKDDHTDHTSSHTRNMQKREARLGVDGTRAEQVNMQV
jgi:hypothetical protein